MERFPDERFPDENRFERFLEVRHRDLVKTSTNSSNTHNDY